MVKTKLPPTTDGDVVYTMPSPDANPQDWRNAYGLLLLKVKQLEEAVAEQQRTFRDFAANLSQDLDALSDVLAAHGITAKDDHTQVQPADDDAEDDETEYEETEEPEDE